MSQVFSTSQLRAGGFTKKWIASQVSKGRIRRLRRGWYATVDADAGVVTAVAVGGNLTCVSALDHSGAWTMPYNQTHVRVASGTAVTRLPNCRLHWTHDRFGDATRIDDPLTALGVAIRCLDVRAAVVVIDSALNRGLLRSDEVERLLEASPRGRQLLKRCDARAESGIETLARLALRSRNLRLRLQVAIAGVGRVDILIGDRLVLETDGREWHADFERDRARDRALMALGYLVIRASYRQVLNEWPVIQAQITAIVARRDHLWRRTLPQGLRHPSSAEAAATR